MIKEYLKHHFEPKGDDNFVSGVVNEFWARIRTLARNTNPPALAGCC